MSTFEEVLQNNLQQMKINKYRAKTERLKVLVDFLQKSTMMPTDENSQQDEDGISSYNLAIIQALRGVRILAAEEL